MKRWINMLLLLAAVLCLLLTVQEGIQKRQLTERYRTSVSEIKYFDGFSREEIAKLVFDDAGNAEDRVLVARLSSLDQWHFRWKVFLPDNETMSINNVGITKAGPSDFIVEVGLYEKNGRLRVSAGITGDIMKDYAIATTNSQDQFRLNELDAEQLCSNGPVLVKPNEMNSFLRVRVPAELAKELKDVEAMVYELSFTTAVSTSRQASGVDVLTTEGAQ